MRAVEWVHRQLVCAGEIFKPRGTGGTAEEMQV